MNSILTLVAGIFLVLFTATDLIYTTFAPRGSGLISGPVTAGVWKVFFYAKKLTKSRSALAGAGVVIVFSILFSWIVLLWAGNVLIYSSAPEAVVDSTTNLPADTMERIYFTGYTLSTLGNGDFKAGTDGWRIFTAAISFSGLMLITIAITYMVPVLSAVTQRRALSIRIAAIGDSPQRILLNNWNGNDFKKLEDHFQSLAQEIVQQGQMHLSYPVLHYFQHKDKQASLLPNLAALDEAITLLLLYVPERLCPQDQFLIPLRKAITTFIGSLTSLYINPENSDVPELHINELQRAEVPLQEADMDKIDQLCKRRRALMAMVTYNGWEWKDVSAPVMKNDMDLPSML